MGSRDGRSAWSVAAGLAFAAAACGAPPTTTRATAPTASPSAARPTTSAPASPPADERLSCDAALRTAADLVDVGSLQRAVDALADLKGRCDGPARDAIARRVERELALPTPDDGARQRAATELAG